MCFWFPRLCCSAQRSARSGAALAGLLVEYSLGLHFARGTARCGLADDPYHRSRDLASGSMRFGFGSGRSTDGGLPAFALERVAGSWRRPSGSSTEAAITSADTAASNASSLADLPRPDELKDHFGWTRRADLVLGSAELPLRCKEVACRAGPPNSGSGVFTHRASPSYRTRRRPGNG